MAEKSKAYIFKMHDLVWAKMPSYCHWPGRIVEPNTPSIAKLKKSPSQHCIFFFGSNNYAWLEEKSLKPFNEFKEEFKAKGKPKDQFVVAMNDIESFIENPDGFSALFEPKTPIQKKKSTPKPKSKTDIEADFDSLKSDSSVPSSPSITTTKTPQPVKQRSSSVRSNEKPKTEKVPQAKRKSTRESEPLLDEEMDVEPEVTAPPAKKPRKSSQAPGSSPRNESSSESSRRRSDITETSKTLKSPRRAEAATASAGSVYGLIGVGIMGGSILQNLLTSGHEVVIYNRTPARCESFAGQCTIVQSAREVFEQATITFVCVSDCDAVKEVVCDGERGIIASDSSAIDKGLVMLSSIDCETSRDIQSALLMKGSARYLEAQLQGSREQVKDGRLIVISAGDKSLYDDCKSCFNSIAKDTYYLGEDTEAAVKMNLILQTMAGVQLSALTEALALADSLGLQLRDILEIISLSNLNSEFINEKGLVVIDEKYREPSMKVDTMQKDLKMAIEFGDSVEHPLPLAAASKELFKAAKRMGFGQEDAAAVYFASNFQKLCYDIGNYGENGTI